MDADCEIQNQKKVWLIIQLELYTHNLGREQRLYKETGATALGECCIALYAFITNMLVNASTSFKHPHMYVGSCLLDHQRMTRLWNNLRPNTFTPDVSHSCIKLPVTIQAPILRSSLASSRHCIMASLLYFIAHCFNRIG